MSFTVTVGSSPLSMLPTPCPDARRSGAAVVFSEALVRAWLALGPLRRRRVYAFITRPVEGSIIGFGIPKGFDSQAIQKPKPPTRSYLAIQVLFPNLARAGSCAVNTHYTGL